jgi:hypothetical protein
LLRIADFCDVPAENADAERVKGGGFGSVFFVSMSEEFGDSGLHFPCGFVGEGNGKDAVRSDTVLDKTCDSAGNGACFTGACTGEDEQGTFESFDGGLLSRVQRHEGIILVRAAIVK